MSEMMGLYAGGVRQSLGDYLRYARFSAITRNVAADRRDLPRQGLAVSVVPSTASLYVASSPRPS